MCCLPLLAALTLSAASCSYMKRWEMETGRMTALVKALNWGILSYVLIGHMVDWDQKEKNTVTIGYTLSYHGALLIYYFFYKHSSSSSCCLFAAFTLITLFSLLLYLSLSL